MVELSTQRAQKKRTLLVVTGWVITLLEAIGLLAWRLRWVTLAQLFLGSLLIRHNSALEFLLNGLSLFAIVVPHLLWLSFSAGLGILTATLLLWQALTSWQHSLLQHSLLQHDLLRHSLLCESFGITDGIAAVLSPVVSMALLEGILVALLVALSLRLMLLAANQKNRLERLNQDLSQATSLLKATLEATADGILVLDAQGRKVNCNTRFAQMWRIPDRMLQSLRAGSDEPIMPFVLSQLKDPEVFRQTIEQMLRQPGGNPCEVLEFKDGRIFECHAYPQWLDACLVGHVLSFRNVTEYQQSAAKVAQSLSVLQATLESTADGIIVLDQAWNIIHFNQNFLELWQISDAEIAGYSDRQLVKLLQAQLHQPESFIQQIYDEYDTPTLSNQSTWTFLDGRVLERYSQPQWLGDSSIGRVVSYRNITDRYWAETALREETQRQSILLSIQRQMAANRLHPDAIMQLIVEQTQQLTQSSGAVIELLEESELVYRAASGTAMKYVGLRLDVNASFSGFCLETGTTLYCQDSETDPRVNLAACRSIGVRSMIGVPLQHNGVRIGVLKVFAPIPSAFTNRDVQMLQLMAGFLAAEISLALEFESKQAVLAALQESEERYRSVVTALDEGVILQDAQGVVCASNASAERILGISMQQLMGYSSIDPRWRTIHEDGSPFPKQEHPATRTLQTGKPCHGVVMGICNPDGKLTWISINSQPLMRSGEVLPYAVVTSFTDITDRKQAETLLRQSERRYRAIVEDQTELIVRYLLDGTLTFVNKAFCRYFGVARAAIVGQRYEPVIFEDDRKQVAELLSSICLKNPVVVIENRVVVNGEIRWTQWINRGLFDLQGHLTEFQAVGRDITERKQLEQALFHEKELAQVTLQSIGDAVITTDALGNIEYFNPVAEALTGWKQAEVQGLPLTAIFKIINETTRQPMDNPIEQALLQDQIVGLANHAILVARDGTEIAIEDSAAPIHDRTGEIIGAVMVFQDVTQTRALSRQLAWQASHDTLTGLVNRREFEQQLEQALDNAKRHNQKHALCYLDLDRFKIVNDTCGHDAGDELLRQVTALLQAQIRKTDILARLGGDEFGVLLHQCPLEQALRVANTMRECLQAFRFIYQGQSFTIGVSIGLVGVTAESDTLVSLLSSADAACYMAKNKGRNRVHMFQPDDEELLQQRGDMQWVARLTQALEDNCFCLHYQPIAAITGNELYIDHYEVLLRLQDDRGNLISPMAFIPAAERYNLMHRIDRWVIHTLFSQWTTVTSPRKGIYAINLSGASLNDEEFIGFLYEQFATYPIPPQAICFEITETVAIANLIKTNQLICELQHLGCRFALDDFGSGMSSFGYLKNLSVDYLKIDGGFIKNIATDPVDAAMVEAITHIGHVMGIKTIAEFVENDAILERIKAIGVDYAQGYRIAAPCPYPLN